MAKDGWSKFREKEERRDEEERQKIQAEMRKLNPSADFVEGATADKLMIELISKCETLMDQISNLYQMWIQGMERTPPVTQRKHLEDLVLKIQSASKPTANLRFRVAQFQTRYATFRDKWERIARDVETGKIVVRRRGA